METLEAAYVEKFQCDGTSCDAKCCRNWLIDIDDKTLSKYKHIKPASKAKEITSHIKKSKNSNSLTANLNYVEKTADNSCYFLREDMLCNIQKTYGENFLSKTCRTYPRTFFKVSDGFFLRSLNLSCPTACHFILNYKRPINFHSVKLPSNMEINYIDLKNYAKGYMMPLLQITGANILQAEHLSIDERLATLALFAESANDAKNERELAAVSEAFEKEVLPNAKSIFAPLKFNARNFLKEIFEVFDYIYTNTTNDDGARVYFKFVDDLFELLPLNDENRKLNYDKINELCNERFYKSKSNLFEKFGLQLENYLLHQFLVSGLPVYCSIPNIQGGILKFILEYKITEFVLVCFNYAFGEKFHEVGIELAAADFSTLWEHNVVIKTKTDEKYKDVLEVMPTLQLLLKM